MLPTVHNDVEEQLSGSVNENNTVVIYVLVLREKL